MFDLQKWCTEHGVIARSEKAFYTALETYKNDDGEEYSEVFYDNALPIVLIPDKVQHVCNLPDFDSGRVYVDFCIEYDAENVGCYRMIYDLDGSAFDDYLVIE